MTIPATQTIRDNSGNCWTAYELGEESRLNLRIECDADNDDYPAVLYWTEELSWHRDYVGEDGQHLFDEDGWLTDVAAAQARQHIEQAFPGWDVAIEEDGSDEPNFSVSIAPLKGTLSAESTVNTVTDVFWPVIAWLVNQTDPGTFGSTYWLTDVVRALDAAGNW